VPSSRTKPPLDELLSRATFTSLHHDWLPVRQRALADRLRQKSVRQPRRVLLLNATLGLQLYPSIIDFMATLQEAQPDIKVTSCSYFDEIHELAVDVARRGFEVISPSAVATYTATELERFDVVIAIGPSDAFGRLLAIPNLRPRLVLLDLGFYHQLIKATDGAFLRREGDPWSRAKQENRVVCYSCQPAEKVNLDLGTYFSLPLFEWRWFACIPLGLGHAEYYRSDRHEFDVALLGSDGRDYAALNPELLRGLRFLFVGSTERAPEIAGLLSKLDITVAPRVGEDGYARLLSLCRCVALPLLPGRHNVLLSVIDALASGKPVVTSMRSGFERLAREPAPILFHDRSWPARIATRFGLGTLGSLTLAAAIRLALADETAIGERALTFAREQLDIYRILSTIVDEQVL
jgi:hypothetical protein